MFYLPFIVHSQGYVIWIEDNTLEAATTVMTDLQSAMDGLNYSNYEMRMELGRDLTRGDPLPLDNFLIDADVVNIIKNCHEEILKDNQLFDNEELLCRFFCDKSIDKIKSLFAE